MVVASGTCAAVAVMSLENDMPFLYSAATDEGGGGCSSSKGIMSEDDVVYSSWTYERFPN